MAPPPQQPPSAVGFLWRSLPRFVRQPPIEAVVFAWGVNEDGQTGLADRGNILSPKVVDAFLGMPLAGRDGAMGHSPIVAGSRNTLAIDGDGQVWSMGWNDRGTLGLGHRETVHKPQMLSGLQGVRIVQVAVNGWHCLALSDNGHMYAWGGNEYVQCGIDVDVRDILTPTPCLPHLKVKQVACGGMHSLALTDDGSVWTWGEPWGDFSLVVERHPRPVAGAVGMAAIAAGAFHNLALSSAGEVYTWGQNDYGQLGNGHTTYDTKPRRVVDMEGIQVADITAGGWHSLAVSVRGEVFTWGRGEYGRLGIGDTSGSSKLRPQKVRGLEGHRIVQVAAGGTHTLALSAEGRVFCWGRASFGRLGLGDPSAPSGGGTGKAADAYSPQEVSLPGGQGRWYVCSIAAGGRHSLCLALPLHPRGGSSVGLPASESSAAFSEAEGGSEASLAYRDGHNGGIADRSSMTGFAHHSPALGAGGPVNADGAGAAARPPSSDHQQVTDAARPAPAAGAAHLGTAPREIDTSSGGRHVTAAAAAGGAAGGGRPGGQPVGGGGQGAGVPGASSSPPGAKGVSLGQYARDVDVSVGGSLAAVPSAERGSPGIGLGSRELSLAEHLSAAQQQAAAGATSPRLIPAGSPASSGGVDGPLKQGGHSPPSPSRLSAVRCAAPAAAPAPAGEDAGGGPALGPSTASPGAHAAPNEPGSPTHSRGPSRSGTQTSLPSPRPVRTARAAGASGSEAARPGTAGRSTGNSLDMGLREGSVASGGGLPRAVSGLLLTESGEGEVLVVEDVGAVRSRLARELELDGPSPGLVPSRPPAAGFTDMHALVDMSLEVEEEGESRKLAARARRKATRRALAEALAQQRSMAAGAADESDPTPGGLEGDSTSPGSGGDDGDDEEAVLLGTMPGAPRLSVHAVTEARERTYPSRPMSPSAHPYLAGRSGQGVVALVAGQGGLSSSPITMPAGVPPGMSSPLRVVTSPHESMVHDVAARLAAAVVGSPRSPHIPVGLSEWGLMGGGSGSGRNTPLAPSLLHASSSVTRPGRTSSSAHSSPVLVPPATSAHGASHAAHGEAAHHVGSPAPAHDQ